MNSSYKPTDPVYCRVCGRVILRRPGMAPSMYLKSKYHVDDPVCSREYRRRASIQAGETRRRKRAEKKAEDNPQFMIMPVIHNRSTNY